MITERDLQGHWHRDWITAPGFEDRTTRVHWLQAGALFADLRIPLDRPDITGLSCLANLGAPALRMLMNAEGFAGHISVEANKCTWHRQINWHGVPEQTDIGLMSFDDAGGLIEDGVLAEYRELWQPFGRSPFRGLQVRCGEMIGLLIENDTTFLLAIGPNPIGTSKALVSMLEEGTSESSGIHQHFASTYVLGHWDGGLGMGDLSTNPFYEGKVVLERGSELVWHSIAFNGETRAQNLLLG